MTERTVAAHQPTPPTGPEMWFDAPAERWVEALPLGNGTLGMMVHGGVADEHLQVNDGTCWSGSPLSESAEPTVDAATAADAIARARRAIETEDYDEAARQLQRVQHRHSQAYLPFADVHVRTGTGGAVTGYRRSLDLGQAVHRVVYDLDGSAVTRTAFSSRPHGVGVLVIRTEREAGLDLSIGASSELRVLSTGETADGLDLTVRMPSRVSPHIDDFQPWIEYSDEPGTSLEGALAVGWRHDGEAEPGAARATGVRNAVIVLATATTFAGLGVVPDGTAAAALAAARARVEAALLVPVEQLEAAHRADHTALFGRGGMRAGDGSRDALPLDRRLQEGNAHPSGAVALDPGLAALMYDYGRYLLIGSSRPGGLPANLQGIWNDRMRPPWSSNYTTNINVEMNYWGAETANLAECAEPLFDLIGGLSVAGRETARRLYDAPGWVAHHNTDLWLYTQPVGWGHHDPRWAFWPLAGAWLSRHLWERVLFGADDAFVRDRAWGPIRSAAEFLLAWLVEQDDGTLGTIPSTSPENAFAAPGGGIGSADRSSTMDLVLIDDLFRFAIAIDERLGLDDPIVPRLAAARARISAPSVGAGGLIREWRADRPQVEPNHRHVSHLYFAFPGDLPLTPELAAAVSSSLDARGDESTGWSLAWKVALRARLHQPERVDDLLRLVFRDMSVDRGHLIGGVYANLMVAHPPFQIDGNLGFVGGMVECVLQSHAGVVELLPALPRTLPDGELRGMVARPGIDVDVEWRDGGLVSARLTARADATVTVRLGSVDRQVRLPAGETHTVVPDDFGPPTLPK